LMPRKKIAQMSRLFSRTLRIIDKELIFGWTGAVKSWQKLFFPHINHHVCLSWLCSILHLLFFASVCSHQWLEWQGLKLCLLALRNVFWSNVPRGQSIWK
jgi:hypothetical protein